MLAERERGPRWEYSPRHMQRASRRHGAAARYAIAGRSDCAVVERGKDDDG